MRHWRIWLYLVVMIAILISCAVVSMPQGSTFRAQPTDVESNAVAQVPAEPTVPPESEVEETATIESPAVETEAPTEAPVETEVAAAEQVDQCVECHTDKDTLINTAAPVEEVVEESEGAG